MSKGMIIAGVILVAIGIAGLTSGNWRNGGKLEAFEKTWTFDADGLRELNIRSEHKVNITFVKGTNGTGSVYLKGEGSGRLAEAVRNTELSGGELELDLREPAKFGFLWFGFHFRRDSGEIIVTLPEDGQLEHFGLHGDSGRLAVSGAEAAEVDISADSGGIEIQNLKAGKLSVSSDSGSIRGSGIDADSVIRADSGSVRMEGVTGPISIRTDSGSIKLYKEDTADTEINADSGSVYVRLPGSFAGTFDLRSDSGKISAPDSKRETNDLVLVRTDSGRIQIEQ